MRRKPARKIKPVRGKHYRWKVPLLKNGEMIDCESRLERYFVRLLDFDRNVLEVESQPICIAYSYKGKSRKYYPDFKVITSDGQVRIVEVKPKSKTQHPNNVIKFIIGKMYCETKGWEYQIVTEGQIFNGFIQENIDILRAFGHEVTSYEDLIYLLNMLSNTGTCTIEVLQSNCSNLDPEVFYKCLYKLIYHQKVYVDLYTEVINEHLLISLNNKEEL
ncbi:TnsA endonuclease N-terminal domain-containing protein [Paenibacillus oenotherae]|uniref:TnsA endonuclease N-terminal domain-containing protein n=1 Tax=Paenibacillus oenotherae TaxID=1435645 RepID=A0ABS7D393_9BACL|nr:TnsA endonuclease N-terminal domain-containing protein [Paenibacillus oenotherae]MBW7474324.1 TnsA endonuclease N-terminal domain-containing protein [Paenibacillus oenotherae]